MFFLSMSGRSWEDELVSSWVKYAEICFNIIIIIIYCSWVVTRLQWLFYMYKKHEIGYY